MYEKGKFLDLALDDCNAILHIERNHTKARMRKITYLGGNRSKLCCLSRGLLFPAIAHE